jgi:catechol 2,3-dioxygenase-like lactoylglutathione lyase family enzyme
VAFKVRSIDHVEVFVSDIPAAIRWYGEALGLVEMARWDPEPVMIGAGGTMLALFRAPDGARPWDDKEAEAMRWHRVAWLTDPTGFESAQKHLAAKGIAFRGPVDHGKSHSIYFRDPDGHPLEITVPV